MNLYTAIIIRDTLKEFINTGSWKGTINDLDNLDRLFEIHSFFDKEINRILVNTVAIEGKSLYDIMSFEHTLDEKIKILKSLLLDAVVIDDMDKVKELGDKISIYNDRLLKLSEAVAKLLVSKEIKTPGIGKD